MSNKKNEKQSIFILENKLFKYKKSLIRTFDQVKIETSCSFTFQEDITGVFLISKEEFLL